MEALAARAGVRVGAPGCLAAELPAGVVQLVQGGADAGARSLAMPASARLVHRLGRRRRVGGPAGRRRAGSPVQCEMGGQNAAIVLADAEVGRRRRGDRRRRHGLRRPEVHGHEPVVIAERRWRPTARRARRCGRGGCVVENPADAACEVGPLISADARDGAWPRSRAAVGDGARVLTGGSALDGDGNYLAPALVELADPGAELAQEEVFAPVVAVIEARDAAQAVELTNGVRYGLSTSIFTRDLDRALDLAGRVDTGLVRVNQPTSGVDLHAPFGGEKASGLGPREQGKAARDFYTVVQDDPRLARRGTIVTRSISGGAE